MKQTDLENLQLGRLVADSLGEIERLGYSKRTRHRYRTTWGHLIEFSHRKELGDEFSGDLMSFLEEYASGTSRWMSRAMAGAGVSRWKQKYLRISPRTGTSNVHSRRCRQSILFRPCRKHFVITNSIVRIGSTFSRGPFTCLRQKSRIFEFFPFQERADTGSNSVGGSVRVRVLSRSLKAGDGTANRIAAAFFSSVPHHA